MPLCDRHSGIRPAFLALLVVVGLGLGLPARGDDELPGSPDPPDEPARARKRPLVADDCDFGENIFAPRISEGLVRGLHCQSLATADALAVCEVPEDNPVVLRVLLRADEVAEVTCRDKARVDCACVAEVVRTWRPGPTSPVIIPLDVSWRPGHPGSNGLEVRGVTAKLPFLGPEDGLPSVPPRQEDRRAKRISNTQVLKFLKSQHEAIAACGTRYHGDLTVHVLHDPHGLLTIESCEPEAPEVCACLDRALQSACLPLYLDTNPLRFSLPLKW